MKEQTKAGQADGLRLCCLLDFSVCSPFFVHSVFITLYSVSPGLCSLHQLDGFRNSYTVFPSGNQCFMEVRI